MFHKRARVRRRQGRVLYKCQVEFRSEDSAGRRGRRRDGGDNRGGILATSGVEVDAMRLLGAFYDLSEGRLTEPVPIGDPEPGAAPRADLDPDTPECDIAIRYLVDQRFIAPAHAASEYT